jgi:hypothetical protein
MRILRSTIVAALALPGLGACHDVHTYDLTRGPFLTLVSATPASVTVSWTVDYSQKAKKLVMERKKVGGNRFKNIAQLPANAQEYTDDTVKDGRSYRYRLHAVYKGGGGERSVILRVDVPEAVPKALVPTPILDAGLSALPALDGEPRLSPDGRRLLFADGGRVRIADEVSGESRPASEGVYGPETGARWMPDGDAILFTAGSVEAPDLYWLHLVTGECVSITTWLVAEDGSVLVEAPVGGVLLDPEADVASFLDEAPTGGVR